MNEKTKHESVVDYSRAAKNRYGLEKLAEIREKLGLKKRDSDVG